MDTPEHASIGVDRLPRHPSAELLRVYLNDHDTPCPVCGYNLRGVVGVGVVLMAR